MGALPRPDIPPGSHRELVDALHALHHTAGWPSLRHLAREVGASPTTISVVFSAPRLPSWGLLSLVVEALDGDEEEFRQLWLAASAPEESPSHVALGMAGRREELAVVRRHLESGTGLLLVMGEAGIGKTKLVDTARRMSGAFVARGAGLPLSVEVPFLPVSSALDEIFHAGGGWLHQALEACPAYVPSAIAPLLPELASGEQPSPSPDASARPRLLKAVGVLLGELRDHRPLALLFEDLHWADQDTLDLVEHLLSAGVQVPLLGTIRADDPAVPEEVEAWSTRVRRRSDVRTLELPPLSKAETAEQIRLLRLPSPRGTGATGAIIDRIYARSRGRPLFTEQLAAQPEGPLPRLLDDVLRQRIANLAPDEGRVAATLAVADRGLHVDLLASATGLPPAGLIPCLRGLADRRLLADVVDSEAGVNADTVALRHPLLAEAIRRHLVAGEAADAHRRLAVTLVGTGDPAEVAAHWQGAGDVGQELAWRVRAARNAHAAMASREEARQWQRALDLWPDDDLAERSGLRRIDAAMAQLDALVGAGQTQQAWGLVAPLLERVDALPPMAAAEVLYRASAYDFVVGTLRALTYAERAVALYEDSPPSQSKVRALGEYAYRLLWAGRVFEALEVDRRLLEACRALGDATELRRALVTYAGHLGIGGWGAETRALLDEARGIETPQPDPAGEVFLGEVETDLVLKFGGGPEALLAAGRNGLAAADEWHLDTYRAQGLRGNVAAGLLRAGRVTEAAQLVDAHVADASYIDAYGLHAVRIALDTVRGRLDEAARRLDALQGASSILAEDREVTALVSPCELWSGRPDRAYMNLFRLLEATVGSFDPIRTGECQVLAVRAAADLAEKNGAQRTQLRRQVARLLSGNDPTDVASEAQQAYKAARAAELSRLAATHRPNLWVAAAQEWDAIGRPFESAYSRWRGAQAAMVVGHGTLANTLLRSAAAEAREHVPLTGVIRDSLQAMRSEPANRR